MTEPKKEDTQEKTGLADYIWKGKKCYWKRPIHMSTGTHQGKVTEGQMKEFLKKAPKTIKLENWLNHVDLIAQKEAEIKRKMRAKLGYPEDKEKK